MRYVSKDISQKLILLSVILLIIFGFVMVISTTYIPAGENYSDNYFFIKRHLISVVIASLAFFSMRFVNFNKIEKFLPLVFFASVVLLVLTLVPGLGIKIYGARRWIQLPFIRFQTSELAKIAIIFFLVNYYNKHIEDGIFNSFLKPLFVVSILLLFVLLEPDFSTTMVLIVLTFGIMAVAGVSYKYLLGSILAFASFAVSAIFFSPYRLKRFLAFLDPWKDPANTGFQIIQSYIAIYLGGFWGAGLGNSKEKLFYLPEAHNDFILSIIAEEMGALGVIGLFVLFAMIVYSGLRITFRIDSNLKKLLAFSISFLFFLQFGFNVSVVVGLFPVTGVPLPFLSYGGTSLITNMLLLGILYELSKEI